MNEDEMNSKEEQDNQSLDSSLHWFMQIARHKLQLCHHFNDFDLRHQSRHDIASLCRHYRLHLQRPKAVNCKWLYLIQLKTPSERSSRASARWVVELPFVFNCYRARKNYYFETINGLIVMTLNCSSLKWTLTDFNAIKNPMKLKDNERNWTTQSIICYEFYYNFIDWRRIVDWTSRVNNFNDYCGASEYNFVTL